MEKLRQQKIMKVTFFYELSFWIILFLCRNLGTPHKQLQHLRCDLCSWSGCQCGFEAKATFGDHMQSRRFAKPPQFENFPQPSNADSLPNNCMLIKVKEASTRIRNNPIWSCWFCSTLTLHCAQCTYGLKYIWNTSALLLSIQLEQR